MTKNLTLRPNAYTLDSQVTSINLTQRAFYCHLCRREYWIANIPPGAAAAGALFAYVEPKTHRSVNPRVGWVAPPHPTDADRTHTRRTSIESRKKSTNPLDGRELRYEMAE